MTLDGKIATPQGKSKWITSETSRAWGMKLRRGADAVLVGISTVLADDPSLTVRGSDSVVNKPRLRRIILDSLARTPPNATIVRDRHAGLTTIVVSRNAPKCRVSALAKTVRVWAAPTAKPSTLDPRPSTHIGLGWLLRKLGREGVTSLLVEGGGEVNASFLLGGFAHRIAFLYAPKILGGRHARPAVAGDGLRNWTEILSLQDIRWQRLGPDLLLSARLDDKTHRLTQ